MQNLGNVTFQDWREFETEFLEAWGNVRDATEKEAYKILMPKIPHKFRNDVFNHEMKKYGTKPKVFICNIGEFTNEQAALAIKKFTQGALTPQKVEKIGPETYHVQVENLAEAQILTGLDKQITAETRRIMDAHFLD